MKTVTDKELVYSLRTKCDSVSVRLWIASPFIGHPSSVLRILGNNWIVRSKVNIRLLTDLADHTCKNFDSIRMFAQVAQIKSLHGLHAKIYIIDDEVLVTSANLTATAFSARYEIGQWLPKDTASEVIEVFERWWNQVPAADTNKWLAEIREVASPQDEPGGTIPPRRFELPPAPQTKTPNIHISRFRDYRPFLNAYQELAGMYASIQRLWDADPLYLEFDCFLNFLFHEAVGCPSKLYTKIPSNNLTAQERLKLLKYWAAEFAAWPKVQSQRAERMKAAQIIQSVVNADSLKSLSREMVNQVVDNMHSLYSNALARKKFLNPENNSLETIASAWRSLTSPVDRPIETVLEEGSSPFGFGSSSVQELIGWIHTNTYPIRNANTNAGMRFFGYNVKPY